MIVASRIKKPCRIPDIVESAVLDGLEDGR